MAEASVYEVGQGVRLSLAFTVDGTPANPGAVTVKVLKPSGQVSTYTYSGGEVARDSTGNYHVDITVDQSGTWHYRGEGTTPAQAADEQAFKVEATRF